jgi:ribosomal protein S18 acetylase RimI-like enzyme
MELEIVRTSSPEDFQQVWPFFKEIVSDGDTYSFPMDCTYELGKSLWYPENGHTYLAKSGEDVVGSFYLKPNQPGLGSHVANAGYMVNPKMHGKGIGRLMAEFSLNETRQLGYQAMQFNLVVSTNKNAIKLWEALGFKIIGTSPQSFRYKDSELVDAFIMHRFL